MNIRDFMMLVESESHSLAELILDWSDGYEKDDAFEISPERAKLEQQIVQAARGHSMHVQGTIYRGTAIEDELYLALERGETIQFKIKPSGLLTSWSKLRKVADHFARDSWDGGEGLCAIVIQLPASALGEAIDVNQVMNGNGMFHPGEQEVIVPNQTISLSKKNIVAMYPYKELERVNAHSG